MVLQDSSRWRRYFRLFIFVIFTVVFVVIIYTPPYRFTPSKEVVGWEVGVIRDTKVYVVPGNDTTILGRSQICSDRTVLCIIVTSAPGHFEARQAIRDTWASHLPTHVALAFLLGIRLNSSLQVQVEEENERYRDVIQEDFIDSYNNLTIKSVFMLKWFNLKCHRAKYLVKSDDDMYLNVSGMVNLVSNLNQTNGILVGSLIRNARPILNHHNKWYSPRYMFSGSRYPDYVSGTTYLMSSDVAAKLYSVALSTPIFHLEDVFITGICASVAGVKRRGDGRFTYSKVEVGCYKDMVAIHEFTPSQLLMAWESRNKCSQPRTTKPSTS